MIQPNELRIGNYISIGGNKMVEIVEVGSFTIRYLDDTYNDNFRAFLGYDYLKPIELTEEILLKCGFEELGHLYKLHLLNSLNLIYNSEHNGWYLDIYHNTSKAELRYVHELQNLYFALTGKELEIQL